MPVGLAQIVKLPQRVVAVDPGPEFTALIVYDRFCEAIIEAEYADNEAIRAKLASIRACDHGMSWLAIEMIASYGMPVGREVFETCVWIGHFVSAWDFMGLKHTKVYRKDVKLNLCGSVRAKDGNVRQAIVDRLGPPGTKKNPGLTYGISGDLWAALGVALTFKDNIAAYMAAQEERNSHGIHT
jgi:hypothetical protein